MSTDATKKKPTILSHYRLFNRNYTTKEMLGEVKNLMAEDGYGDFMFIATGRDGCSIRLASKDMNMRYGDILWMMELARRDIKP